MQEFTSKERCEAALQAATQQNEWTLNGLCVQK